jgi:hypothetical protein
MPHSALSNRRSRDVAAVRAVSVNKGVDPRDTAIIAFRRRPASRLRYCGRFVPKSSSRSSPHVPALGMLMASGARHAANAYR